MEKAKVLLVMVEVMVFYNCAICDLNSIPLDYTYRVTLLPLSWHLVDLPIW